MLPYPVHYIALYLSTLIISRLRLFSVSPSVTTESVSVLDVKNQEGHRGYC